MSLYDPRWVAQYFDEYADQEWQRLVRTPLDEVQLQVHAHYLHEHVNVGDRVLEVGAGAGQFTQILVNSGARVTVADISSIQLELNRKYAAAQCRAVIEARVAEQTQPGTLLRSSQPSNVESTLLRSVSTNAVPEDGYGILRVMTDEKVSP